MGVIDLTQNNYEQEVTNSQNPVLIDFWASWCGPCQMLSPIIEEVAKEVNNVKVCKVNVDKQQELARSFEVMSIPKLVLIKDGKIVDSSVGLKSKEEILEMLNK